MAWSKKGGLGDNGKTNRKPREMAGKGNPPCGPGGREKGNGRDSRFPFKSASRKREKTKGEMVVILLTLMCWVLAPTTYISKPAVSTESAS